MRAGATYASGGQSFDDNKFFIIQTQNGNRPMFNIQAAGAGCLQAAIAQGTVKQFNQSSVGGVPPGGFRGEGNYRFRWCDAPGSGIVSAGEWITISMHVTCASTLHASGSIRAMNLSRVVGPVAAGALLAAVSPAAVFVLNAVLAIVAFALVLRWKSVPRTSALPGERFLGAMRVGLNFAMQSPRLKVVKVAEPAKRTAGVKVESAAELVSKLKTEAGVI